MADPDPNDVEKAFEALENLEQNVEGEESEVEEIEDKVQGEEAETEEAEKKVDSEINDSEENHNIDELEDAERNEKKILDMLENQEELIEKAIEDIEREVRGEIEEEKKFNYTEDYIQEAFNEALNHLEKRFTRMQKVQDGSRNYVEDIDNLVYFIRNLEEFAKELDKLLDYYERFLKELEETEKEEFQLEELQSELRIELNVSSREIKQVLRDTDQVEDRSGEETAVKEKRYLEDLIGEWKDEENEMEKIDKKLQEEVQDVEKEIEELEELMEQLEKGIELLNSIEKLMKNKKEAFSYRFKESESFSYEEFMKELDRVRKELIELHGEEVEEVREIENEEQSVEKGYQKAVEEIPDESGDQGSSTTFGGVKTISIAIISILAILIFLRGF